MIDAADPAVTGFHQVLARDAPGTAGRLDLAAAVPVPAVPVAAVILAGAQPEYAARAGTRRLTDELGGWLATLDCARMMVDTRLAHGDWRNPATAAQVEAVIGRADVVVTTRLHGLVLALKQGVPVLAMDPVTGGAKVAAQAAAWGWPVLLPRSGQPVLNRGELDRLWTWCRSAAGRARAGSALGARDTPPLTADLLSVLNGATWPGAMDSAEGRYPRSACPRGAEEPREGALDCPARRARRGRGPSRRRPVGLVRHSRGRVRGRPRGPAGPARRCRRMTGDSDFTLRVALPSSPAPRIERRRAGPGRAWPWLLSDSRHWPVGPVPVAGRR